MELETNRVNMRNFLLIIYLFSCSQFDTLQSQSTERFIRIIGNSKHEFISEGANIGIQINEILENTRTGVVGVSYDSVFKKFTIALNDLGLKESNLELNNLLVSRGSNVRTKSFTIHAPSIQLAEKITTLKIDGVNFNSIEYTYPNTEPNIIENMLLQAIEDAKRKANNIARETGLTLGKILNIEDNSGGCCGEIKPTKEINTSKSYNVTITFELKDK